MTTIQKKRILILSFVFSPNIGGVESHLDDLTAYLSNRGFNITVITYKTLGLKEKIPIVEKRKNLTIIRIPWFHPGIFNVLEKIPFIEILYLVPPLFLFTLFYLLRNSGKTDVIQVHGFNMAIVGAILSWVFRIKLIINTHVSFYFHKDSWYAKILSFFLKRAEKILVLTSESKEELIKIGIPTKNIVVYHQWIDEKMFNPKSKVLSRKKLQLDAQKFIVLFVGRFSPAKGISILVESARKFNDKIQLVIVGSGPLESFIRDKSINTKSIKLVGKVSYADLPYYYCSADAVVIPSTPSTKTYSEGIPRVLIEAYRCGTPALATPAGGVKEHITTKTGILIEANPSAISRKINQLSKQKTLLEKLGKNARHYALSEFSLAKNALIIEESLV